MSSTRRSILLLLLPPPPRFVHVHLFLAWATSFVHFSNAYGFFKAQHVFTLHADHKFVSYRVDLPFLREENKVLTLFCFLTKLHCLITHIDMLVLAVMCPMTFGRLVLHLHSQCPTLLRPSILVCSDSWWRGGSCQFCGNAICLKSGQQLSFQLYL